MIHDDLNIHQSMLGGADANMGTCPGPTRRRDGGLAAVGRRIDPPARRRCGSAAMASFRVTKYAVPGVIVRQRSWRIS
jgi:hypothetical protein